MTQYLYFTNENALLINDWLYRNVRVSAKVTLVCAGDALPYAQAFLSSNPALHQALDISSIAVENNEHIVLPMTLETRFMQHQLGVSVPQLSPHYALFQKLWRCGFRHFTLYSLNGQRELHIPHILDEYAGCHKGQRCFVVGNGPSLQTLDMALLKNEITLGSNRCYLGYESWGFQFTYWGLYDQYQAEMHHVEYEQNIPPDTVKFFPMDYLPYLNFGNACPVNIVRSRTAHAFLPEAHGIHNGYTVSFMLLQIAALMGCDPIYLVGMDHRYGLKKSVMADTLKRTRRWAVRQLRGTVAYDIAVAAQQARLNHRKCATYNSGKLWGAEDAAAPTHFDGRYTAGETKKFAPPEPAEAERDFICAAHWAKKTGVNILNASPNSALKAFPKVSFSEIFE